MPVDFKQGDNKDRDNSFFWRVALPLMLILLMTLSYKQQEQTTKLDPAQEAYLRTGINPPR